MAEAKLKQKIENAINAHKKGDIQKAYSEYLSILKETPAQPEVNHNLGMIAVTVGQIEKSLPYFEKAIVGQPDNVQFWRSFVDALFKIDRIDDARKAVNLVRSRGINDDIIEAKINRISEPSQNDQKHLVKLYLDGQYIELQQNIENLLDEYPHSAFLLNMKGATHSKLDENLMAIKAYENALEIKPNYAEVHNNLGNSLQKIRDPKSKYHYSKAIELKENYVEAYLNLANAQKEENRLEEALENYINVIKINPNDYAAMKNVAEIIPVFNVSKPDEIFYQLFQKLITEDFSVTPERLAGPIVRMIKKEPTIKNAIKKINYQSTNDEIIEIIDYLSTSSLLLELMRKCPLPDMEIENLLSHIRRFLLLNIYKISRKTSFDRVLSALSIQCFINEYIYFESEVEKNRISELEQWLQEKIEKEAKPNDYELLCLSCYRPLSHFKWSRKVRFSLDFSENQKLSLEDPLLEAQLKKSIKTYNKVTNELSKKVREQYERYPYPRWIKPSLIKEAKTIIEVAKDIDLNLEKSPFENIKMPKILIAGCGTGHHVFATASRFKAARIIALDLSYSSLSYAHRKSNEYGLDNVEFIQGDILDLPAFDEKFDIIESVGVLHHMEVPKSGWVALKDCLKPRGLMHIGLYSGIARQNIKRIREEIKKNEIKSEKTSISQFRQVIGSSDKTHHKEILNSSDFYSTSSIVDLLFNVEEHTFTIPLIVDYLSELNLNFCGFETQYYHEFRKLYGDHEALFQLGKWHDYETKNPHVFGAMYQFWCQAK